MVWRYLEILSALLDEDERQSVLGDIQERGPTLRAAVELTALVLLRQILAISFWKTWVLCAALWFPCLLIVRSVERIAANYDWPARFIFPSYPWILLDVPILAWSAGFALAVLEKRGSALILAAIAAAFWFGPQGHSYGSTHGEVVASAFLMFAIIPGTLGFVRGVNRRPLPLVAIRLILILGVAAAWSTFHSPVATAPPIWAHWPLVAAAVFTLKARVHA